MNESEVRALLAVAVAYDNRKPGAAAIAAWTEAAGRGRWSFDAALEAIHQHYAMSTEFLMPGHITATVRAQRRQPVPAAELVAAELVAAAPAAEETVRRFSALIRERFAVPRGVRRERRAQRRSADAVAAREAARRELDAIRDREREEPSDDVVG